MSHHSRWRGQHNRPPHHHHHHGSYNYHYRSQPHHHSHQHHPYATTGGFNGFRHQQQALPNNGPGIIPQPYQPIGLPSFMNSAPQGYQQPNYSRQGNQVCLAQTHENLTRGQQKISDVTGVVMVDLPFFEVLATPLEVKVTPFGTHWVHGLFVLEESLLKHFRARVQGSPYEVQVRFCRFDQKSEQKDFYASGLQVKINGQICLLPGWNQVPKAPAVPIEITSKCDFQKNQNQISVRMQDTFVMFIHVLRRRTHEDLLQKLLAKSPIDSSTTVARIKEKLQQDSVNGVDITLTSLHFSLMCPVSKARIGRPCRASTCRHLQCFDAAIYLKMNEKKPKWTCPVCSDVIEYKNLQIDEYFNNILEQNVSCEKILLQVDGSYIPFQPKDMNESILTLDDTVNNSIAGILEPHSTDGQEQNSAFKSEPHPPRIEQPHSTGGKQPHSTGGKQPHSTGGKEPHSTGGKEQNSAGNSEPHPPRIEQPHSTGGKEQNSTGGKEQNSAGGKEQNSAGNSEPHPPHIEEPHSTGIEEPHNTTIDLCEDDSPEINFEEWPALTASSKDTQNHTEAEVVILSDDESLGSPARPLRLPLPPHRQLRLPAEEDKSSPRSRRRKLKKKAKKTKQITTIIPNTSTPIDRPGTRMVLRSHLRGTKCKNP